MSAGPKLPDAAWRALPAGGRLSPAEAADQAYYVKCRALDVIPAMTIGGEVSQARRVIALAHRSDAPASMLREAAARLLRAAWLIDAVNQVQS